jgi:hypothetical protein
VDHLPVNCFYDVNYEPEREMADLIRTTTYIQTAEDLAAGGWSGAR